MQFLHSSLFGNRSPFVTNLRSTLGKVCVGALFAVGAPMLTAQADVFSADTISVGADQIWSADVPALPSDLVIETNGLSISPTGILDLKDNTLIVHMTSFATVNGYVVTGYNGGAWDGYGIQSSTAAADSTHLHALGAVDNSEAHYTTFAGRDVSAFTETLVTYTYYGDANLDGDVNAGDLLTFGTGSGSGWYHGDFNYDGTVNGADLALYTTSLIALHPEQIPEPGLSALLAVGAMSLLTFRRARSASR